MDQTLISFFTWSWLVSGHYAKFSICSCNGPVRSDSWYQKFGSAGANVPMSNAPHPFHKGMEHLTSRILP